MKQVKPPLKRKAPKKRLDFQEFEVRYQKHQNWLRDPASGERLVIDNIEFVRDTPNKPLDLSGSDLSYAILTNVDFNWAKLEDANLEGADLTGAKRLHPHALAGAVLKNASIPADIAWPEIGRIEEISKNCGKYFVAVLAGAGYVLLTALGATDANLIGDGSSSTLPFLQIPVQIVQFYWDVPILLLAAGLFFWLNMQMLWENVSHLPAVSVSGLPIDEVTYPWIVNSVARFYSPRLQNTVTTTDRVTSFVVSCLSQWLVPVTLWVIWNRCLPRHDTTLSAYQAIVTMLASWLALRFQFLKSATLMRNRERVSDIANPIRNSRTRQSLAKWLVAATLTATFWICATAALVKTPSCVEAMFRRTPASWKGIITARLLFDTVHCRYAALLDHAQISTRPSGFAGSSEGDCLAVQGGSFKERDIQNAMAQDSFLVNSDLRNSNFSGADLENADLRAARLEQCDGHVLMDQRDEETATEYLTKERSEHPLSLWNDAHMQFTDLRWARCAGVSFVHSDLSNANLAYANMSGCDLSRATLWGCDLSGTRFKYCSAYGADFTNSHIGDDAIAAAQLATQPAHNSSPAQNQSAKSNTSLNTPNDKVADFQYAQLSSSTFVNCQLPYSKLQDCHLEGAHMSSAFLVDSHLERAHLDGADLTYASLQKAFLNNAWLEGAHLEGAHLDGARLPNAHLENAHLTNAELPDADLKGAHLEYADLSGIDLSSAHLEGATAMDYQRYQLKADLVDATDMAKIKFK